MTKDITVTVNTGDYNALTRVSDMLHGLAQDIAHDELDISGNDNNEVVVDDNVDDTSGAASEDNVVQFVANANTGNVEGNTTIIAPEGVTLADGLPWDVRIHAGSKKTYAKPPYGWKLKRGVDATLVEQVEAELRAAMGMLKPEATADTTTVSKGPKPPAATGGPKPPTTDAVTPVVKYVVEGIAYTADELKAFNSGWNDENITALPIAEPEAATTTTGATELTFPDLLAKITAAQTAKTLTNEAIAAALTTVGNANGCVLSSMVLVGARPDLIPAIDTALFG